MATRINPNMQAHEIHANGEAMWHAGDVWLAAQSFDDVKAVLVELDVRMNGDDPTNILYRLAFTALLELVERAYVRESQAAGDDDDAN